MRAAILRRERMWQVLGFVLLAITGVFYGSLLAGGRARGGDLNDLILAGQAGFRSGWISLYYRTGWEVIRTLPLVPALYFPLGLVSRSVAYLIWTGAMLGCTVGAWWLGATGSRPARLLWLAALIASFPLAYGIGVGQVVPVVLLLVAATDRLLERRPELAGGGLALALQVKPTLGFLAIPVLLAGRGVRAAVSALVISAGFLLVYLLLMGPTFPSAYAHATGGFLTQQEGYAIPNQLGTALTYGLRAAAGAVALAAAWRRQDARFSLAIGVAASLVASPYVHPHDLLVAFIAGWALQREAGGWVAAAVFVPGMLVWTLAAQIPGAVVLWDAYLLVALSVVAFLQRRTEEARPVHAGTAATVD